MLSKDLLSLEPNLINEFGNDTYAIFAEHPLKRIFW